MPKPNWSTKNLELVMFVANDNQSMGVAARLAYNAIKAGLNATSENRPISKLNVEGCKYLE